MQFITKILLSLFVSIIGVISFSNISSATTINNQIRCLATNAYYEANGQPLKGQIAVMNVVMNRSRDPKYPSTPCGVIYQRSKGTCQFSWVCSRKKSISHNDMIGLTNLATQVYNNKIGDVTDGAKHFHARGIRPPWAKSTRITTTIGSHIFYKL